MYLGKKVHLSAFNYLKEIQQTHTKVKKVPYKTFEIAPYLTNSKFHIDEKMLLFKLRTSMINVKGNFKSGFDDTSCGFCQVNVLQTQEHLFSCMGITKHCQALQNNIEVV